jgi:uncharacterized phage protein gp47/JayE
MQLPVLTFSGLLEQMAAGLQGAATQFIDLTIGSVLRAILESCASVALWLQWLVLQVLATTRAATSVGPDLDSWMADFSFTRLPGAEATGLVQFARYTPGIAAVVPVGCQVLTSDGTQSFSVIEDASNPAWNGAGGYTMPALLTSIAVPAQANMVGLAGNVLEGAIGVLASPINGIDTVTNGAAFSGGAGAESDADFRNRFLLYINSRSLATVTAIMNAVSSVGPGLRMTVIENVDAQFNPVAGSFVVVADDGSGMPSDILLANVQAAVDAVRPIGSIFAVQGPATISASVTVTLETSNPLTHAAVAAGVQQAVTNWIKGLPIAGILAISKIDAIAHAFDSSVVSVTSTLINGAADDIVAPINGVILATSVMVS